MSAPPAIVLEGKADIAGAPLFPSLRLELDAGKWTSLLGASGVGKSTLLRLIAGLDTGASFDGRISTIDGAPICGRVAFMGQSDLLAPWLSAVDNVTLGARLRGTTPDMKRAQELLARVGLADKAEQKPSTLSGGERQRASLARTLMEGRPIVLLDEPFSALDARTRAEVQEIAGDLLRGCTVLLVTHDPAEAARLSDRAFLMSAQGLTEMRVPQTPPVRPVEAPETLAAQAEMFRLLRGAR